MLGPACSTTVAPQGRHKAVAEPQQMSAPWQAACHREVLQPHLMCTPSLQRLWLVCKSYSIAMHIELSERNKRSYAPTRRVCTSLNT